MSEYDTITDLATEINDLKAQIDILNDRLTHSSDVLSNTSTELSKQYTRQYEATIRFQNYIRQLTANFGDQEVAETLNVPIQKDFRVAVPITHTVYITVTANSEEEALDLVANGDKEYEIRSSVAYASSYEFEQRIEDATVESTTYTHPLNVPLFVED